MQASTKTTLTVHKPVVCPKFTNIGYGNPRYNSMVPCEDDENCVIVPCGTSIRKVDIVKGELRMCRQVGCSQIFQILRHGDWLMVVNFQGLVSLLHKADFKVLKQFYVGGKEIRHSAIDADWIAVSCQLINATDQASLELYAIHDIMAKEGIEVEVHPRYRRKGYYYYPELVQNQLVFIQFHDPNPKGRSRTETVLTQKLPIKHKILKLALKKPQQKWPQVQEWAQPQLIQSINVEGQILCASQNSVSHQIFYLHQAKKLTILNLKDHKCETIQLKTTSAPHCVEAWRQGILYPMETGSLGYLSWDGQEVGVEEIKLQIKGLTSSYSIKKTRPSSPGSPQKYLMFNQQGLQHHNPETQETHTLSCFDITNCGISFNKDASKFVVADFGGNVYIFNTEVGVEGNADGYMPKPISQVLIGIPVRSLAWCHDTDRVVVGCVGGYLFQWDTHSQTANLICQTNDHTVNIVRYHHHFVIFGTSDGYVHIMDSKTLGQVYRFQAHHPIHYQSQKDRELFGSMKNYAEIWSIIAYPAEKDDSFYLVTSSQDQTQKVFLIEPGQEEKYSHKQEHHLVGHSLAVTSIDWKVMGKGLGPIYVSCSDDKIVRFRNPTNMFEIVHELETSTIKEWHTLTYLALEPNGHRVAIGSQNGYLFIFDILTKELLFGEKIHLGGVQGMDWINGKLLTCSSDLCVSIGLL